MRKKIREKNKELTKAEVKDMDKTGESIEDYVKWVKKQTARIEKIKGKSTK